jgi:hypothetical protein
MSDLELEQRMKIKFLVKLEKSGNDIREMLVQVYGDNSMKKTAVYKWVKRFSDEERSRRPATSRTGEHIKNFVKLYMKIAGRLSGAQQSK